MNGRVRKVRLDVLVHERGLAESRAKAQALILAGQVVVGDQRVDKPGAQVPEDAELRLKGEVLPYVSRGGLKLKGALDHFSLNERVRGAVCADIGASTGGFTDCLLQEGAARVHAIDVGYGQLHEKLRVDPRVISRERVNARHLTDEDLPEPVDIVVIDVSGQLVITDCFVIASASNERQVNAIVDEVEEKMRLAGYKPARREGTREGRWVLLDYVDIVVHIQHQEERNFYALDRLWRDCPFISVNLDDVQTAGAAGPATSDEETL